MTEKEQPIAPPEWTLPNDGSDKRGEEAEERGQDDKGSEKRVAALSLNWERETKRVDWSKAETQPPKSARLWIQLILVRVALQKDKARAPPLTKALLSVSVQSVRLRVEKTPVAEMEMAPTREVRVNKIRSKHGIDNTKQTSSRLSRVIHERTIFHSKIFAFQIEGSA
jgi:hypothetical protein